VNQTNKFRILSIAPTTRGFGYAVLEGENSLIAYCGKTVKTKQRYKNLRSIAFIEKIIIQYRPDVLVLYDVNAKGIHRQPRIKELHRLVITLAKRHKLKTVKISVIEVWRLLLGNQKGTKHAAAELLAKQFPDELASRLPPKRKCGHTEDRRMDIFDAVGLVLAFRIMV
jgi:Holliday junction resolvasome RuvABC endonuclease subunit